MLTWAMTLMVIKGVEVSGIFIFLAMAFDFGMVVAVASIFQK